MASFWVLLFYLASPYNGGPGVAEFASRDACEMAAAAVAQKWSSYYRGHLCLKKSSGRPVDE